MARNKKLLMKEIRSGLDQAQHVLATLPENPTFQEIMTAASSANQAANQLYRLAGMLDVEADLPKN
jgi:hypothetical protein